MCLQGSGEDEIVVCACDGMTYIVDQGRNVVRYQFEENVSAFCVGKSLFCIGTSLLVNEYFPRFIKMAIMCRNIMACILKFKCAEKVKKK